MLGKGSCSTCMLKKVNNIVYVSHVVFGKPFDPTINSESEVPHSWIAWAIATQVNESELQTFFYMRSEV